MDHPQADNIVVATDNTKGIDHELIAPQEERDAAASNA